MTFGKTALRCWLPAAALLLALLCPLPVAAARAGTAIPVSVRTDGAAADAVYTVELTPLDAAPAPVQRALTVKNGGTVYFTGFAFDEPGDYRYLVAERSGGAAHTTYDAHSYTVTVRVTGRPDGGLAAGLWAVRSGETAKADGVLFVTRYDPPETAAAAVTASAAAAGGCGGVKTPPYGAKDTWAVMARWRAGHARPLRGATNGLRTRGAREGGSPPPLQWAGAAVPGSPPFPRRSKPDDACAKRGGQRFYGEAVPGLRQRRRGGSLHGPCASRRG